MTSDRRRRPRRYKLNAHDRGENRHNLDERERAASEGQAAAKLLWESLPEGTPVFVSYLGGRARSAKRTAMGWESDDGMMGCTPWSVRLDEVWVRSDLLARARATAVALEQQLARAEETINRLMRLPKHATDAIRYVIAGLVEKVEAAVEASAALPHESLTLAAALDGEPE